MSKEPLFRGAGCQAIPSQGSHNISRSGFGSTKMDTLNWSVFKSFRFIYIVKLVGHLYAWWSWIFIDVHFSWNFHFSLMFIDVHWFSLIFIDFRWFLVVKPSDLGLCDTQYHPIWPSDQAFLRCTVEQGCIQRKSRWSTAVERWHLAEIFQAEAWVSGRACGFGHVGMGQKLDTPIIEWLILNYTNICGPLGLPFWPTSMLRQKKCS